MGVADDALLSDLCSICNTNNFKYRCPGCAARTCSLSCYRRHQQWAQCTGRRDPTKFVKKSQLATPAGIDHDFNFLTGIERGLETAERSVQERGPGTPSHVRQGGHTRIPTDQQFAAAGVEVIRAPNGLSRQKENKTHRSKAGNIVWTVEWIWEDKTRILTEGSSASPLLQLQPFKPSDKRSKKRKRPTEEQTATQTSRDQDVSTPTVVEDANSRAEVESEEPEHPSPERGGLGAESADASASRQANDNSEVAGDHHSRTHVHGSESESVPIKYSFFLLRPRTSSSCKVLIPLEPTATLADCLRGRTVLEFPTFHVFPFSTAPSPNKYMLDEAYAKKEGEEQQEFEALIKSTSPDTLLHLNAEDASDKAHEEIDSEKILDVLKQDIGDRV